MKLSRREVAKGALALAVLPACGPVSSSIEPDAGPVCGTEHPELAQVGGSAVVHDSATLLHAIVFQPTEGCFKAVWEICPHGSCEIAWQPENHWLECPCHGSRFGEDGVLLRGPATRSIPAFSVVRDRDTLWLKRSV